jgi:hypothetical protein
MATLGDPGTGLVLLTPAQLNDGPWCPDGVNQNRFDADLLRIRKIRVSIRLQTPDSTLRGSMVTGTDALFTNAGTGSGYKYVPDQMIRFDIAPRNMNLAR